MNVYLVTSGEYSDYCVDAAFSTKELAEEFVALPDNGGSYVEEFELDPDVVTRARNGYKLYFVRMERNGDAHTVWPRGVYDFKEVAKGAKLRQCLNQPARMEYFCWAKGEEDAIKIANEKRAQLISDGVWEVADGPTN